MPRWRAARRFRRRCDRRPLAYATTRAHNIRTIGQVFRYSGPGNPGRLYPNEGTMGDHQHATVDLRRLRGGEPGTLHVMFHGTFVFDFHDNDLDVLIPEVEGHVYRAGSWL